MFHLINKNRHRVFPVKSKILANHMTINHVIGMSHCKQEPMESGRYMYHDIHWDIINHNVIHFAFTKMAESQTFW